MRTEVDYVSANSAQPRLNAVLLGIFSTVALVIAAAFGVYGILAYSVNQRTREIGLRMALGASAVRPCYGLVVREGMTVGLIGIVHRHRPARSRSAGRSCSLLFGVPAYDPMTFISVYRENSDDGLAGRVRAARGEGRHASICKWPFAASKEHE